MTASGLRIVVLGEDVDMWRLREDACIVRGVCPVGTVCDGVMFAGCGWTFVAPVGGIDVSGGLICVCILVLTTSSGHVITPAMPPADAAVAISRPRPMSLLPAYCLAHVCSCS